MSAGQPTLCGARNGSYTCQFEHGEDTRHAGLHYAYFISAGRVYVATWVDQYGRVKSQKAPVPKLPRR